MTVEIDFDVFKSLTNLRTGEEDSMNDVLRRMLRMPALKRENSRIPSHAANGDMTTKGIRFPAGTEFRANHKGQEFLGRIADGQLVVAEKKFASLSRAAMDITGGPINGWTFWECRIPGQSRWQTCKTIRESRVS
jgi:predicted CopG family antitoxin